MTNKSKNINDIVSQTARALGSGKSFGGWTDTVEEDTYNRHVKKQHASREREKEEIKAEKKKEEPSTYPKIKKEEYEITEGGVSNLEAPVTLKISSSNKIGNAVKGDFAGSGKTWDSKTMQNKNKESKPLRAKDTIGVSGMDPRWNNDKTWSGKGKKVNQSDYLKM